jgi:hypothetical protein
MKTINTLFLTVLSVLIISCGKNPDSEKAAELYDIQAERAKKSAEAMVKAQAKASESALANQDKLIKATEKFSDLLDEVASDSGTEQAKVDAAVTEAVTAAGDAAKAKVRLSQAKAMVEAMRRAEKAKEPVEEAKADTTPEKEESKKTSGVKTNPESHDVVNLAN